jgi:hypothetical protein
VTVDSASEYVGDTFKLARKDADELIARSEHIGFVDAEGRGDDKLLFNGNLFRRESITKIKRVLDSLSAADSAKGAEVETLLAKHGCVGVVEAERILGVPLFEKLKAAGMYDLNQVANPSGEFVFVTRPAAFHKFTNPLLDDAFDLAKALVAALTYGMTQSAAGRGRITMIGALLRKLISGQSVGPATAIGEDYRVLEQKGVIRVTRDGSRYRMKLLKRDIGEIALDVLTKGEAVSATVLDRPLPRQMTGYTGPERNRTEFRKRQSMPSKRMTLDVLDALRTGGGL